MVNHDYLDKLKQRAKESRVSRKFQLEGLEVARILGDEKNKTTYITLAKRATAGELLRIAKEVAEERRVKNKGAYFMSRLKGKFKTLNSKSKGSSKQQRLRLRKV